MNEKDNCIFPLFFSFFWFFSSIFTFKIFFLKPINNVWFNIFCWNFWLFVQSRPLIYDTGIFICLINPSSNSVKRNDQSNSLPIEVRNHLCFHYILFDIWYQRCRLIHLNVGISFQILLQNLAHFGDRKHPKACAFFTFFWIFKTASFPLSSFLQAIITSPSIFASWSAASYPNPLFQPVRRKRFPAWLVKSDNLNIEFGVMFVWFCFFLFFQNFFFFWNISSSKNRKILLSTKLQ